MGEDVGFRASITLNFDLHSVNRDAITQTFCPEQITKKVPINEYSASARSLIACSDLEDDIVNTICCNDWKEAVIGWRPAAPCVKYAWSEPKKHASADGTGESKKHRGGGINAQKHDIKEIDWRCTVEPGTYRYSPGGFHRNIVEPILSGHSTNIDERNLLVHLERVRDHFEKTLKCANKPMQFPSWKEIKNDGNSHVPQRSASEGTINELTIESDYHSRRRRSSKHDIDGDLTQAKSAEVVTVSSSIQQESQNHNLQEYKVHKVEINGPFGNFADDHTCLRPRSLRLTKVRDDHSRQQKLMTDWGSSSPSVLLHEADLILNLNPLQKVTPQQRKIRDDHEVAELRPCKSSDNSTEHSARMPNSKFEPVTGRFKEKSSYTVLPIERYEQLSFRLDTELDGNRANMDTSSHYSQTKDFSCAKELHSVQEILQAQKYLSQHLKEKTDRKRHKPHRLRALHSSVMRGSGDLPNTVGCLQREPLHRGIIDRKSASDLATELLPGVNGQGLHLPLYVNRIT